jgi:DNA-binding transcriptional LysR family regulator
MDIKHLRALVAVAEHGSFSGAADALGTVQSNISAHVARLERELATTLVDRAAGQLTGEGEVVVARAYRILGEMEAVTADLGALRAEVGGTVRLGMVGTLARWITPILLAELASRHPRLRLVVADGTTSSLEPLLAAGRFDMAVLTLPVPGRDLTFESLFEEDLVLVVPREDDPLVGVNRIALSELSRFELLLPAPGTAFRTEIDSALRPAGVSLRPQAELDGVRLLASLAFEGYGPAILPATAVPPHLRPRFRSVRIDDLPPRHVVLAQRTRGLPSAGARAVAQTLHHILIDPAQLPDGVRVVLPELASRAEGSLRLAGMPND